MAVATKSKYSTKSSGVFSSFSAKAHINLKPTPQPQSSLKGYEQSERFGSKTATAGGSFFPGRWWSQMIKSMPFSLA